jgi:hypothetical protein
LLVAACCLCNFRADNLFDCLFWVYLRPEMRVGFLVFLSALLLASCKQENDTVKLDPLMRTGQSLHMMSKLWEMVHLVGMGQAADVLPPGVRRVWIDSTLADMDGMEYEIDFGRIDKTAPHGRLCPDGFYRSGKFIVRLSSYIWMPGVYAELIMNADDTCTWSDGSKLIPLRGKMIMEVNDDWSYALNVALSHGHEADSTLLLTGSLVAFTEDKAFPGRASDLYRLWGSGKVAIGIDTLQWEVTDPLYKRIDKTCMGTFHRGQLDAKVYGKSWKLDYNPYGNDACDRWIKAWQGRSEYLFQVN